MPSRRLGGSDIGKLLGLSKYGNEADVYLRVVEGIDDEWNPLMERGAAVEPQLRAFAQRFLELELEDSESDYHDCPRLEFARAQVDDVARFRGVPVCVDYKSQNRWVKGWGAPNSDEVPASIHAQIAWEMLCTDRPLGILVVGFGEDVDGPDIFHIANVIPYQVERDEEFEALCVNTARDFWNRHVLPKVPPSIKPLGKKKQAKS
jgi:hypothetical protein